MPRKAERASAPPLRTSDAMVIAAWSAVFFGLLEGLALVVSRSFPAVLAAHKVSADILWVAPLVDLPLFLLATAGVLLLLRVARRWLRVSALSAVCAFSGFMGFFTLLTAPAVLHPISAALLAIGLTTVVSRRLRGSEGMFTVRLRRRLPWIPVLLVVTALGVTAFRAGREAWVYHRLPAVNSKPASSKAANVLLIVLDTVRYDSFSRRGKASLTPNLDRITARGARFESAWAASSWSLASQASILSGRYPHEHGADWPHLELREEVPTLAEYFAERGYVTGAFSSNAAWVTPEYLGRGFLRFDVYGLEDLLRRTVHGRKIDILLREFRLHYAGRGKRAAELNAQFLDFLDDYEARPFFSYLCYMDVNRTFHDRRLNTYFRRKAPVSEVLQAYEQGLRELDTRIGELFAELERRRRLENTMVIVTSDHGESFGVEVAHDHDPSGHGTSLYPEQTRVPLFVIYEGMVPAARKILRTVSLGAIPTTVTSLLEEATSPFGGEPFPLRPAPEAEGDDRIAPVLSTLNYEDRKVRSLIWDHWQYINDLGGPRPIEELYDLAVDPGAQVNRAGTNAAVVSWSRGRLEQLLSEQQVESARGRLRSGDWTS